MNRDYTFQNYLIGDYNKDAIEAISSAMRLPGQLHNPLYVYGPVGVGKTHLLQALAQKYAADLKICYATIEMLINNMIQAILHHRHADFVEHYLSFDVLIIDDIHLISDRKFTIEELLQFFGRLHNARKQIIISADRAPMEIFNTKGKAYRIFKKGIVLKIQPPGYGDRLKFLQTRAQDAGLSLGDDIYEGLLRKTRSDFRELQGIMATTKLSHALTQEK